MTPAERMQYVSKALKNPCDEAEHVFEDSVASIGEHTMLQQVCKVCFTIQGWVYSRD